MRAVYMQEPHNVSMIEMANPQPGAGDVLIRIHRVGLCGTDLQSYRGVDALTNFPLVPGHELGGEVVSCGQNVPKELFPTGSRVTVKPYFNCGHCYPCQIHRINCCENSRTMGVQMQEGALCDYVAVPYQNVLDCGKLSYEEIALIEPLSVGTHLVSRANIKEEEYVLIFGCGVIGSGAISAAYFRDAKVIVADVADEKKETAMAMGAVAFINPQKQDLRQEIDRITGGAGVSVALECIGIAATMAQAIEIVNFAGRVGYVGYSKKPLEANATLIVKKELTIVGSRNALIDEFICVKENLSKGKLDFRRLVSAVYPPDKAFEAFAQWDQHPGDFVKIQIDFE